MRSKPPDAPYDDLSAEHREMDEFQEELEGGLEAVAAQAQAGEVLDGLHPTVTGLTALWHPQMDKEHLYLYDTARTEAVMSVDEQIQLNKEVGDYSQQQGDPGFLVPFLLYNLSPEERATMTAAMPPALL